MTALSRPCINNQETQSEPTGNHLLVTNGVVIKRPENVSVGEHVSRYGSIEQLTELIQSMRERMKQLSSRLEETMKELVPQRYVGQLLEAYLGSSKLKVRENLEEVLNKVCKLNATCAEKFVYPDVGFTAEQQVLALEEIHNSYYDSVRNVLAHLLHCDVQLLELEKEYIQTLRKARLFELLPEEERDIRTTRLSIKRQQSFSANKVA